MAFKIIHILIVKDRSVEEGRGGDDTTNKMVNMQVPGKRRRGRPKKRWLDNIRDDMKE